MKQSKMIPLILGLTLTLTGCEFSFGPFNPNSDNSSSEIDSSNSGINQNSETLPKKEMGALPTLEPAASVHEGAGYHKVNNFTFTAADYHKATEEYFLPSIGTQKVLVIPVEFKNAKAEKINENLTRNQVHDKIHNAFFGSSEDTEWESLRSYYYKSSGGSLIIEGEVAPFYQTGISTSSFENLSHVRDPENAEYYDPTWTILENAIEDIKAKGTIDLREFDQNNDGFIDAVFMVYMANYSTSEDSSLWAYQYFDYDSYYMEDDDVNSPAPFNYAWASIYFMFEGYGDYKIDAHTYIHESGHILGLDDYYTYTEDDWGALGGVDMMDYNIGDHNGYSKMALDWKLPYYVDGTESVTEMTLVPGDLVVINDSWNKTAFDEYLLLEFYTPTGLNDKDLNGYPGNGLSTFTEAGLKLYHVDSRLGKYDNQTDELVSYTKTLEVGNNYYPYIAMSNSSDPEKEDDYKLIHLIEPNGGNSLITDPGSLADDSFLFYAGDKFIPSQYDKKNSGFVRNNGIRFNDGTRINYEISVTSVNPSEAKVTITKI